MTWALWAAIIFAGFFIGGIFEAAGKDTWPLLRKFVARRRNRG